MVESVTVSDYGWPISDAWSCLTAREFFATEATAVGVNASADELTTASHLLPDHCSPPP